MTINLKKGYLPQGWVICKLPDFTRVVMGQSPPSETYNYSSVGLPFFQGKAEFGDIYPKIDKYCSKPNKIADFGGILLSIRAPVGPTNLVKEISCIGRGLAAIHPMNDITSKFILFLFRSIEPNLAGKGTGSTFKAITKDFIDNLKFGLPPIEEQRRIVAKIEELFSKLDKGIESLKAAQTQLKNYRQSLLKEAFEGKLTAAWRAQQADKLEAPEQLLTQIQAENLTDLKVKITKGDGEAKRYFNKLKKNPKKYPCAPLPTKWQWANLLDVSKIIVDCHNKTAPYEDKGIILIRTPCIKNGKINFNKEIRYISQETYDYWTRRCPPEAGDIIFTREAPVGEVGIIPNNTKLCMGQRMMLIRAPSKIHNKYMLYAFLEPLFQSRLGKNSIGTGVQHLRVGDVEQLSIPVCCYEEQQEIVKILEQQLSVIDSNLSTIEENLNKSQSLRQAILKKAFAGELVPQDASDEPASELLKRIAQEKAQLAQAQAKARKPKKGNKKP